MFARLASYGAPGVTREEAVKFFRERVLKDLSAMEGFQEAWVMLSADSDQVFALSVWDTEENLHGAERQTAPHRAQRDEMGGKRSGVQVFEVVYRSDEAGG
jgi:heme-degrading monooxygenase HmoA